MNAAFGPVALFFMMFGGGSSDLASYIDVADYYKSRNLELTAAKVVDLLGKDQEKGNMKMAQLLGIRWLGENPAEAKKNAAARPALEKVLKWTKKQDPQGFYKEYAQAALARLDGKQPAVRTIPKDSLSAEGLKWFPASAQFVAGLDTRSGSKNPLPEQPALKKLIQSQMPAGAKQEIYGFADAVGNVRIDRLTMTMGMDPAGKQPEKIYMRFTGLADRQRLASFLQVKNQKATTKEEKTKDGTPVTFVEMGQRAPAIALVGDTDIVMAGRNRPNNDSLDIVKEVLDIRAGAKPSFLTSPLAKTLKDVPAQVAGLLAGERFDELDREIQRDFGPQVKSPKTYAFYLVRDKAFELHARGEMAKAEDAKALVAAVAEQKKKALDGLKQLPPAVKIPKEQLALIQKTIEGAKAEAKGTKVEGKLVVPEKLALALPELMINWVMLGQRDDRMPPPPVEAPAPLK